MLSVDDYRRHDAVGLADLIRRREISAEEACGTALSLADRQRRSLNALSCTLEAEVGHQLAGLKATGGAGALAGVPMMIKDIGVFYAGTDNFNGGGDFLKVSAPFDSTIVARYKGAGLVICGKTMTPELALNVVTESRAFGPTRNPHDLSRGVGGSSGGAAAIVAAGIVPVAHGSDNGGSIRIPASSCGVYGLKPSRGVVPTGPSVGVGVDVSEAWALTNCNHVLTRTVRDSARLLDIETAAGESDADSYSRSLLSAPAGLKVALLTESPLGTPIAPVCVDQTTRTAERFEAFGWRIEPARFVLDRERMLWALKVVAGAALSFSLAERARQLGRARRSDDVETITALWAEQGERHTAADYVEAGEVLQRTARAFDAFLEPFDLVLTPTLAEPPLPLGACAQMGGDLDAYLLSVYANVPFLPLFNASGGPAASLPLAKTAEGLPVGIQIGGRPGQDRLILAASATAERDIGFTGLGDRWLAA